MEEFNHYKPPATKIRFLNNSKYHVFLSFRGSDIRKTFVDHLFESLSAAGIHAFLDNERLERGDIIGLTLESAIQAADIRIPIFSKNFAESVWCLKEVTQMWKSDRLIIPLFYDVEPSDVRHPENSKSPYAEAFKEHRNKKRYSTETIAEWKKALEDVSSRSGWTLMDTTFGYEGKLVKRVVLDVIQTLDRVPLHVANFPVGLETVKKELVELLDIASKDRVLTVGVWGMGGFGKTTLAKAVFNHLYLAFDAACFVFDVRSRGQKFDGLTELQREILKDLLKKDMEVRSVDHGKSMMTQFLGSKRILLVLDDVDKPRQLEALKGDWAGPGSRIIVTTRDHHILNIGQIRTVYEIKGLDGDQALKLFCWHAFLRAFPDEKYQHLSKRIVKACCGHPLSLKLMGAFLYDKEIRCWNEALSTSESITNKEIFETLKISYDDLSFEEKRIFLEIACSYIGHETENVIEYWKSNFRWNAHTAVSNLQLKLFIGISDDNRFTMHDLLRDMGRGIVEDESHQTTPGRSPMSKVTSDANQVNDKEQRTVNIGRRILLKGKDYIKEIKRLEISSQCCPSMMCCYYWKKRKNMATEVLEQEGIQMKTASEPPLPSTVEYRGKLIFYEVDRLFELEDLLRSEAELLGRGGFGTAYKIILEDGNVFVVKRLKNVHASLQIRFERHVELIGRLSHPNLVRLTASYYSSDEQLLVYEYMSNGSLHSLLHGNRGAERTILDWRTRRKIAVGTARGLSFIHSYDVACGIIKSSNVLLDKTGTPRISIFGLWMLVSPEASAESISEGYCAPEQIKSRKMSQESDVYGFGVLLLEILTGKDPLKVEEGVDLPRLVGEEWTSVVLDVELLREMEYMEEEMMGMYQIAMACVSKSPEERPKMRHVLEKMIEDIREHSPTHEDILSLPPSPSLSKGITSQYP